MTDEELSEHDSKMESLERSVRELSRTWAEERKSLWSAISELSNKFDQKFSTLFDRMSTIGRPNWAVMVAIFAAMLTLATLLAGLMVFVLSSTVAPIDTRLRAIEQQRIADSNLFEMTIRNDERSKLWLTGNLKQSE